MAKLVVSSAVQPNTLPPSASGATASSLVPMRRLSIAHLHKRSWRQSALFGSVHDFFVKFSDSARRVGGIDNGGRVDGLITFWSYALAAATFAGLLIWRLRAAAQRDGQRLVLGAFAMTACWAWLSAIDAGDPLTGFAETARNLMWVSLLYSLSASSGARHHGVRLVYGAVSAVFGLQLVVATLSLFVRNGALPQTAILLSITAAAGSLVLVHNLYGQAAPASRSAIRFVMLGLALMWTYDLNLYTFAYLDLDAAAGLLDWRCAGRAGTGPAISSSCCWRR